MLEFDVLVLPLNENVQAALQAKAGQGWLLVPGTQPVVIYQLCRPLQQPLAQHAGFGTLQIDESKMYTVDKDGNKVERH